MILICEKCRHIIDQEECPVCGSTETREPADDDSCFLASTDFPGSMMLSETLKQKDIPFRMVTVHLGKYSVSRYFYIPYSRLEEADLAISSRWQDENPANAARHEQSDPDLFSADEIDQMEWSMLDDMNLEELRACKNKIMKTLKEIKVQEQAWKERTTKLLDMKEEAENLIDDLS